MLDTGYWILDTGYWILDTGYWILDARTGITKIERIPPDARIRVSRVEKTTNKEHRILNIEEMLPDTGYWIIKNRLQIKIQPVSI